MMNVADAIRDVTARVQKEIENGGRSTRIDAEEVVQILLSIADRLDPPFGDPDEEEQPRPE